MSKSNTKNVLFIMTGSIACYKACNVLSQLKQNGYSVQVVMTKSSIEFVGKSTIEGLTGLAPLTDMYASSHAMEHINLARWADIIVVAPATANFINKMASGIADDLPSTIFLAHDFSKPFLVAPAMNSKMFLHPVTQDSISKLKKISVTILETSTGQLACGEYGPGRMIEPDLIYAEIAAQLVDRNSKANSAEVGSRRFPSGIKVLVTGGGTSESLDDVRTISNKSTGATSAKIADYFANNGADVCLLHSKNSVLPKSKLKEVSFESFKDLERLLKLEVSEGNYDLVIHAAAVSDYSPLGYNGKIDSEQEILTVTLARNKKLVNEIKNWDPNVKLVAFKLTSGLDIAEVKKKVSNLFSQASCDFVIHNDWHDRASNREYFNLYNSNMDSLKIEGASQVCEKLIDIVFTKKSQKNNEVIL